VVLVRPVRTALDSGRHHDSGLDFCSGLNSSDCAICRHPHQEDCVRGRKLAFLILTSACLVAIIFFTVIAKRRSQQPPSAISAELVLEVHSTPADSVPSPSPIGASSHAAAKTSPSAAAAATRSKPSAQADLLYFSANALGENYGKLAVATV